MNELAWENVIANRPRGQRVGGPNKPKYSPHERKVAINRTVILTVEKGVPFAQKDFLLMEVFEGIKSDKGVGDFIGGLDLDKERNQTGTDWLILPTAWNAAKSWNWLRQYPEDAAMVAERYGMTAAQLETRIIAAVEQQDVADKVEPAVEDALPPAVEDDDDEDDMAILRAALEEADAIN